MKWLIISCFLFANTLLPAKEHKPTLRALIACDTFSQNILSGSKSDIFRIHKSLQAIAFQLHIKLQLTMFTGSRLNSSNVRRWLQSIPKSSQDIVFFYYSGHGTRQLYDQSPWPTLIFPKKNNRLPQMYQGASVQKFLQQRNPRLSIIFFDCCNGFASRRPSNLLVRSFGPILCKKAFLPGLKTLFLETRGMITASAASPGELATTFIRGRLTGGVFTTGFIFALQQLAKQPQVSWTDVMQSTKAFSAEITQGDQHPFYDVLKSPQKKRPSVVSYEASIASYHELLGIPCRCM